MTAIPTPPPAVISVTNFPSYILVKGISDVAKKVGANCNGESRLVVMDIDTQKIYRICIEAKKGKKK